MAKKFLITLIGKTLFGSLWKSFHVHEVSVFVDAAQISFFLTEDNTSWIYKIISFFVRPLSSQQPDALSKSNNEYPFSSHHTPLAF